MYTNPTTIEELESSVRWYTSHRGKPTSDQEWAAHDFGYGVYMSAHGICLDELRKDWPEVFASQHCMRGYRAGWEDPEWAWTFLAGFRLH